MQGPMPGYVAFSCLKMSAFASNRIVIDSYFNLNQLRASLCKAVIECFNKGFNAVDFETLHPMGLGH
jgi:hypothetical protein